MTEVSGAFTPYCLAKAISFLWSETQSGKVTPTDVNWEYWAEVRSVLISHSRRNNSQVSKMLALHSTTDTTTFVLPSIPLDGFLSLQR